MKRRRRVMPKPAPRRGRPPEEASMRPAARPTTLRGRDRVMPGRVATRASPDRAIVADAAVAGAGRVAGPAAVMAEAMAHPAARAPTRPDRVFEWAAPDDIVKVRDIAAVRVIFLGLGLLSASGLLPVAGEPVPRAPGPAADRGRPAADLIITNAKIFTADAFHPECEAVAVLGDRIVAAAGKAVVLAWRGPKTKIIDADGRRGVP